MGKTHSGTCCACGKNGNLTFEHIPPKKTNNTKQIKKIINPIAFFDNKKEFNKKIKEVKFKLGNQKGMGDYTLCSHCSYVNNSECFLSRAELIRQLLFFDWQD